MAIDLIWYRFPKRMTRIHTVTKKHALRTIRHYGTLSLQARNNGLPYPYTEDDAEAFIRAMLSADKNKTFAFAITLDGKVIGSIRVFRQESIYFRTLKMGYNIGKK